MTIEKIQSCGLAKQTLKKYEKEAREIRDSGLLLSRKSEEANLACAKLDWLKKKIISIRHQLNAGEMVIKVS